MIRGFWRGRGMGDGSVRMGRWWMFVVLYEETCRVGAIIRNRDCGLGQHGYCEHLKNGNMCRYRIT